MIKYSPRKTFAEQSLKVFPNILEDFFLVFPERDSNVNNTLFKNVCNDTCKGNCRSSYALKGLVTFHGSCK